MMNNSQNVEDSEGFGNLWCILMYSTYSTLMVWIWGLIFIPLTFPNIPTAFSCTIWIITPAKICSKICKVVTTFFVWHYPVAPLRATLGLGPSLQSPGETELRTQLPRRIDGLTPPRWGRAALRSRSGSAGWGSGEARSLSQIQGIRNNLWLHKDGHCCWPLNGQPVLATMWLNASGLEIWCFVMFCSLNPLKIIR